MATYTTSLGYKDSISTTKNIALPDLDFANDFAVTKETADELILTNVTSPVDQPETLRFGYQNVANVYTNTGIDPSFMATTKRGISVVGQVNDILRITPEIDGCCGVGYDLPIQSHLVVKVPLNQFITSDVTLALMCRAFSTFFSTGSVLSERLGAMLRGALKPSNM